MMTKIKKGDADNNGKRTILTSSYILLQTRVCLNLHVKNACALTKGNKKEGEVKVPEDFPILNWFLLLSS